MANVRGGISGVWCVMQYATKAIEIPGTMTDAMKNQGLVNNTRLTDLSDLFNISKGTGLSNLKNKYLVRSWHKIHCGGRDTGLWDHTCSGTKTMTISEPNVRRVYFGFKVTPMWRRSHKAGGNVTVNLTFYTYNKSGGIINQSQTYTYNGRPEDISEWTKELSYTSSSTDIGSIKMVWTVWSSSNNWHDVGDGSPATNWVPEFNLGGLKTIRVSTLYPYWPVPSGSGSSNRLVETENTNTYIMP